MNLLKTMEGLGHYALKGAKAVFTPLNVIMATIAIGSALSFNEVQAQNNPIKGDTIYATGILSTKNIENALPIENVLLSLTPENMSMVVPDTTYASITDNEGWVIFDNPGLPVYIDSTTGIQEFKEQSSTAFPNPGSEINIFMPTTKKGNIEFYDILGKLVRQEEFNSDHAYLPLDGVAPGIGIYRVQTEDGTSITGKYVNLNTQLEGPAQRPKNSFKDFEFYSATYWAKWEHPDFYTDSTLITLEEGNNGFINFYMTTNIVPIPQDQDFVGIAKDANNNYAPLANITAILFNETLNETTTITTGADGKYLFEDIPAGSVCFLSVGGNSSKYSFNDIPYTVPSTINSYNDTLLDVFSTVLPDKLASSTDQHIRNQTSNGTQETERKYYYDEYVWAAHKIIYNGYFEQLQSMGNEYTYVETLDENEANIHITNGTFNTNTSSALVTTPFGDLYPVYFASCSMGPNNFGAFSHEIYQANGKSQVGWNSVLGPSPPPTGPTTEDLEIAELDMTYWVNHVYGNGETFVDLNLISEDLNNKSPEFKSNQSNSFGTNVEELFWICNPELEFVKKYK